MNVSVTVAPSLSPAMSDWATYEYEPLAPIVRVPYVPATEVPLLLYELPEETVELDPPLFLIWVIARVSLVSASLSLWELDVVSITSPEFSPLAS